MKAGTAVRKLLDRYGDGFLINGSLKYRLILEVDSSEEARKWTGYDGDAVESHVLAEGSELQEILATAFEPEDWKYETKNPALAWVIAKVPGWEKLKPAQLVAKATAAGKLPKATEKDQTPLRNFRRALGRLREKLRR